MSDVVIRAESLGKRYLIGHQSVERESYTALRDVIGRTLKSFGRSTLDTLRGRQIIAGDEIEEFWALREVTFEIKRGEVVGIIGRNGAGKSTLLKILSRITEPSEGHVEIRGRVASLLEVGTGFHPELTGRENIYLNGAILGMTHAEIKRKFDEIVDFAEVEKFLDTPVKRYSSGMYVRLAFAVAAHLEPEILIVDEVLAVGDVEFQKKCLGKMQDVAGHGRTVLFVSHNMAAISALTSRCIYLNKGSVKIEGSTRKTIEAYLDSGASLTSNSYKAVAGSKPSIVSVRTNLESRSSPLISGSRFRVFIEVFCPELVRPCVSFQIQNVDGVPIIHCESDGTIPYVEGSVEFSFEIPELSLNVGNYSLNVYFSEPPGGRAFDVVENACRFSVDILETTSLFGWRPDVCAYIVKYSCSLEHRPETGFANRTIGR